MIGNIVGVPDASAPDGDGGAVRNQPRRWPLYLAAVLVGAGAAAGGVVLAATRPAPHSHHHGPAFAIVFTTVAAVVVAALVIVMLRRQLNRPAMQRLRAYSFAQRRATLRAAIAGQTLTADQQTIAQAQLEQLNSAANRLLYVTPVLVLTFVVLAVTDTAGLRWLFAALAGSELMSIGITTILFRRQRGRLQRALRDSAG